MPNKKVFLSREDVLKRYKDQLEHLKKECEDFDNGDIYQINIISVSLRKLLKDTKMSKSLLMQLDIKDKVKFINTLIKPKTISFWELENVSNLNIIVSGIYAGLLRKKIFTNDNIVHFQFAPLLDANNRDATFLDFDSWYNGVIYKDENYEISRKKLIDTIAEQDGGAHYDESIEESYVKFAEKTSLKINVNGDIVAFDNNPAQISLRQIAYEVITSLELFHI